MFPKRKNCWLCWRRYLKAFDPDCEKVKDAIFRNPDWSTLLPCDRVEKP